jgi:hypothetical protein
VATILQAAVCGTVAASSGWAIAMSREPTAPDTCVTVYDYPGGPPDPRWLLEEPMVQVRVRGAPDAYPAAYQQALKCRDSLLGLPRQLVGGTTYLTIFVTSDIGLLEYDTLARPIFVFSCRVARQPASGTYRG